MLLFDMVLKRVVRSPTSGKRFAAEIFADKTALLFAPPKPAEVTVPGAATETP